jgi:REP element-mobilizing transposase RayT
MVIAYHTIFSAYGFWLPNDPRGSWSEFVGAWELRRFGPATTVVTNRSLAHLEHDRTARLAAKEVLSRPAVCFTGVQARAVGVGIGKFADKNGLTIWACSILPEHVHLVIARHHYAIERAVTLLKGAASTQLLEEGLHPFADGRRSNGRLPSCWARGEWKVFLDDYEDVRRSIKYVEDNPLKEGKSPQRWPFVTRAEFGDV